MLTSNGYVLDESPKRLGRLQPVTAAEKEDREALWTRLRADGYLFLPAHLERELVLNFRRHYFATLAATGLVAADTDPGDGLAGSAPVDRQALRRLLFEDLVPGEEYEQLCTTSAIKDWFAWLLEDEVHLHKRKIIRHTQPGENGIGTATQAHYDLVYLRDGSDRVLSMWIPLGDCTVVRGGLVYLEGSHHRVQAEEREGRLQRPAASITADLPALAEEHDSRWLYSDFSAGDVVVHSAHIIHAALDNTGTDGVMRLSTDIRYQRATEPIDWRWQQHWHDADGL